MYHFTHVSRLTYQRHSVNHQNKVSFQNWTGYGGNSNRKFSYVKMQLVSINFGRVSSNISKHLSLDCGFWQFQPNG